MKHFLLLIIIGLLSLNAQADYPQTQSQVFQRLKEFLTPYYQTKEPSDQEQYWVLSFPTSRPRDGRDKPWANSIAIIFANKEKKISQIAIESYGCHIDKSLENQKEVKDRFQSLVKLVSQKLYDQEYEISGHAYKSLGPRFNGARVTLKQKLPGIRKMKLRKGFYKCDGRSGYGYRLDLFMEK